MIQKYFPFAIVGLAAVIAGYHLTTAPGFWFDEGIIAGAAKGVAQAGVYGTEVAPGEFFAENFWITTGFPLVFPVALFVKIFGVSIGAARLAPVLYVLGFVAISYFFIKKAYGFSAAAWASALLITFSPFYGNGKAVLGEVPGLFWLILGAFLYLHFEEKKKPVFLIGAAVAWGLCVSTKPYYALLSIPILGLAAHLVFWRKQMTIAMLAESAAAFLMPVSLWAFFAFDRSSFAAFGATLSYFLNSYGASDFDLAGNLFRFISESTPIHFSVLGITVVGAWVIRWRSGRRESPIFYVLGAFIALTFFWYLKTPGWYRYFFPAHALALVLFPVALFDIAERAGAAIGRPRWSRGIAMSALLALTAFQAVFLVLHYDDFRSAELLALKDYVKTAIPVSASLLISGKPEAGFVLEHPKMYQYIPINNTVVIGEKEARAIAPDFIIAASPEDFAFLLEGVGQKRSYTQAHAVGHYGVWRRE